MKPSTRFERKTAIRIIWSIAVTLPLLLLQACAEGQSIRGGVGRALLTAEQAIEEGEHRAAHDALLHAMINDPGSPHLFEGTARLIRQLISAEPTGGGDDVLGIAEDLLSRLDHMVPYQDLETHRQRREELNGIWELLREAEPSNVDPLSSLDELLAQLDTPAPTSLKMIVLREAVAEFERNAPWMLQSNMAELLQDREKMLGIAERKLLDDALGESSTQFQNYLSSRRAVTSRTDRSIEEMLNAWEERNDRLKTTLRDLAQWEREFLGYLEYRSEEPHDLHRNAAAQLESVRTEQAELLWNYSRATIDWTTSISAMRLRDGNWTWTDNENTTLGIEFASALNGLQTTFAKDAVTYARENATAGRTRAEAMMKLLLMTVVDIDRLVPYAHTRYEEVWQEAVERLDDDGKLHAAKIRILRASK